MCVTWSVLHVHSSQDPQYYRKGTSNGMFRAERYFTCCEDNGLFMSFDRLGADHGIPADILQQRAGVGEIFLFLCLLCHFSEKRRDAEVEERRKVEREERSRRGVASQLHTPRVYETLDIQLLVSPMPHNLPAASQLKTYESLATLLPSPPKAQNHPSASQYVSLDTLLPGPPKAQNHPAASQY